MAAGRDPSPSGRGTAGFRRDPCSDDGGGTAGAPQEAAPARVQVPVPGY